MGNEKISKREKNEELGETILISLINTHLYFLLRIFFTKKNTIYNLTPLFNMNIGKYLGLFPGYFLEKKMEKCLYFT